METVTKKELAYRIAAKLGYRKVVVKRIIQQFIGEIIHELGTARMGADPRSSVVDGYGRAWEVDNLVLMDGAVFASGAHKNPTLTILALALRASERLAKRIKTGAFA